VPAVPTADDALADRRGLIERITAANAEGAAAHARVLAAQDPTWGTDVFELAGGVAVLCGPGLYVNRAMGIGLGGVEVLPDDLAELERRSAAVGVPASIDVVPTTDNRLLALSGERGYALQRMLTFHVRVVRPGDREGPSPDPAIVVRRVGREELGTWQDVSAAGFDVGDGPGRRASDAFGAAAAAVDGGLLVLATSGDDGRPLGCASLHFVGGLAMLGAMSTLPAERRRGVQAVLVAHRLGMAADAGCELAVSSTLPANASERNLTRAGFRPLFEMATITRRPG
jgi:GNAT superfamily N-acetyltransferase